MPLSATPPVIGAALNVEHLPEFRDWLSREGLGQ